MLTQILLILLNIKYRVENSILNVVLYIITPGSVHPMAIEYAADEATENVDLDDGESYISANGSKWVSVDTVEKSNLCIKAFSDNR